MKFSEIVDQASDLLRRRGRITYRALKLEFDLSDEQLEALKEELIDAQELGLDKDGKLLVWREGGTPPSLPQDSASHTPPQRVILPSILLNVSWPRKRPWKLGAQPRASAKPSLPSLLTLKAPPP